MIASQRSASKLSELRSKSNALLLKDELTEAETNELDKLTKELSATEIRYRAELAKEAEEAETAGAMAQGAGEGTELRSLVRRASVTSYLLAECRGRAVEGAEAELRQALGITDGKDGTMIPLHVLLADEQVEERAATTTTEQPGGQPLRSIMARLFSPGIGDSLGVQYNAIPAGRPSFPLLTAGAGAAMTSENTAASAAVAASFSVQSLRPKRLTTTYEWSVEADAEVTDLESALRRDLAEVMRNAMNLQLLSGSGNAPQVAGIYSRLTAENPAPTAEADFDTYASTLSRAVDGIHATSEGQVAMVQGVGSYRHSTAIHQSGSGESASEALMRRGRSVMASALVPAAVSGLETGVILHAGGGANRGDSIVGTWPSVEAIRDPFSSASSGVVKLTLITLWDAFMCFREGAYKRITFKLTS